MFKVLGGGGNSPPYCISLFKNLAVDLGGWVSGFPRSWAPAERRSCKTRVRHSRRVPVSLETLRSPERAAAPPAPGARRGSGRTRPEGVSPPNHGETRGAAGAWAPPRTGNPLP